MIDSLKNNIKLDEIKSNTFLFFMITMLQNAFIV